MTHQTIVMIAPFGIRPKGTLLARMLPLGQALARRGHRVAIVAPPVQNPQDAGTCVAHDNVVVLHTAQPTLPGPAGVAQQVAALLATTAHLQPSVVHVFKPKGFSGLAGLAASAFWADTPLVLDTDDWEGWGGWNDLLPYPYPAKLLFAWQERDLPRRAAAVTVASRTLQTQVWGFGVAPERVVLLPNGVSATPAPPAEPASAPTMLLYTRFWEFSLEPLIQALVAIHSQRPDARLVVVGKGERGEEQELLRMTERAGLAPMLRYHGWVEPQHLPGLLGSAALALSPLDDTLINRARGLAKLLELMHAGLPVVAHDVGSAREYIEHGQSGVLVPPGDTAAFARAVLGLLADPAQRARLGEAARQRVRDHYGWDTLALLAEQAYSIACRGKDCSGTQAAR